jgi:hypothetical protein
MIGTAILLLAAVFFGIEAMLKRVPYFSLGATIVYLLLGATGVLK